MRNPALAVTPHLRARGRWPGGQSSVGLEFADDLTSDFTDESRFASSIQISNRPVLASNLPGLVFGYLDNRFRFIKKHFNHSILHVLKLGVEAFACLQKDFALVQK